MVCAKVTQAFLDFLAACAETTWSRRAPSTALQGLQAGDRWCLCARRWQEAFEAGVAPPVVLECTHAKALEFVTLEQLQSCA